MVYLLITFILIAVGMQALSISKIQEVCRKTNGVLRSRQDLLLVKNLINLSMRLAILYIVFFVLFIIMLVIFVKNGTPFGQAMLNLFIFGVITLPVGLFGKKYENKIKTMEVQSVDLEIGRKFRQYLTQWDEPRFQLSD
ncbi:hypothetical protein KAW18_05415 [candidate division WOR-3 bacterium]|nr:hypothetical protein [candidate division WOR-3 bacterium]